MTTKSEITPCDEIAFSCYGAEVVIRSSISGLLETMKNRLPPRAEIRPAGANSGGEDFDATICLVKPDPDRHGWCLFVAPGDKPESVPVELAAEHVADALHYVVAENTSEYLFVHAGAVAIGGLGLVLPGRTHAGKSTLVRSLVEAGAVYYSDEYAVFDDEGRMHPYARPLGIRDPDGVVEKVPVDVIGGVTGEDPTRVALVASLVYSPDSSWDVASLPAGSSILRLFGNTVLARAQSARALSIFAKVAENASAIAGSRGDASAAAAALMEYAQALEKK